VEAEFSSKFGWGGARRNSGGPRANAGGARPNSGPKPRPQPAADKPLGPRWYVITMAAGTERRVIRDLAEGENRPGWTPRPGYEALLLLTRTIRLRHGRRVPVDVPMLLGYGFIRFDADRDDWKPITSCDGVQRLFMTRRLRPIPVRDIDVADLVALSGKDLGLDPIAMPKREPGDALVVAVGPFTGFAATVIRCDGITTTCSVGIFGRECEVTLPWAAFEPA
jgi:transcription antitermination factor NusG